jgi:U3 small nucleolar RNA-associated protein 3
MELDAEVGPDGQAVRRATARERHALREAARRARRSELVQELAAELTGAPEELRAEAPGLDSSAALLAARQRMEARARAEEELFARVPLSKAEAKKLKAQQRAGLAGAGGALDDFAEEVADLVGAASSAGRGGGGGGSSGAGILGRLSQRFGADLADQAAADAGVSAGMGMRSGDADLARRPTLHERRAAFDGAAGRKAARLAQEEDEMPPPLRPGGKRGAAAEGAEEDAFYAASRAARQAAKRLKGEAAAQQRAQQRMLPPPLAEPGQEDGELRPITDAIQRNRGLTPHRRRDLKNPRKKHRVKYAQAGVRRKGQVQGVREAPATAGGYGGEATGIKARLARGRKLG